MVYYKSFIGVIKTIDEFRTNNSKEAGCYKFMTVQNKEGYIVNFIISPTTYFVDYYMMNVGDLVEGFYDANIPVIMIYPPQYQALVVALVNPTVSIKVDKFDEQLLSSDGSLKLNISNETKIIQENGQLFKGDLSKHSLIVLYNYTTRSIPPQTAPIKIIVVCRLNKTQ